MNETRSKARGRSGRCTRNEKPRACNGEAITLGIRDRQAEDDHLVQQCSLWKQTLFQDKLRWSNQSSPKGASIVPRLSPARLIFFTHLHSCSREHATPSVAMSHHLLCSKAAVLCLFPYLTSKIRRSSATQSDRSFSHNFRVSHRFQYRCNFFDRRYGAEVVRGGLLKDIYGHPGI